jgi:lysophospholipase L1-like esterase
MSTVLSAAVLGSYLYFRPKGPSVVEVNTTPLLRPLLESRSRGVTDLAAYVDDRGDPIVRREPITEEIARVFYPMLTRDPARYVFDEQVYVRNRPKFSITREFKEHQLRRWQIEINDLGFRGASDVRSDRPDLRILIAGDSHVEGVVPMHENAAPVLEDLLRDRDPGLDVEALNAALGGYSFYNYLGVIEKHRALRPDVFVVVVYGGNDFGNVLTMTRYFHHMPHQSGKHAVERAVRELPFRTRQGVVPQWLRQVVHYSLLPEDRRLSLHVGVACLLAAARICESAGIELVCVYLPAAMDVQPWIEPVDVAEMVRGFGIEGRDFAVPDELARKFLSEIGTRGVRTIDLRADFASAEDLLYWRTDHHLNTRGHRRLAEALVPVIEELKLMGEEPAISSRGELPAR